ncbi:hypothetical protein [Streptomyces sp. NPDC048057]|uniref:metallophosphoesterase family protein n=1 Tax=Streptomyces sp. NPDC048057 TaxID=3155628 RepID=UPI0033F1A4B8
MNANGTTGTRLYFATDLRAADRCFTKFLSAASTYDAQVLVLGGNLTGTRMAPVVRHRAGEWRAVLDGVPVELCTDREVAGFERRAADVGAYAFRTDPDELAALDDDPAAVDALFHRLAAERLRRWLELAADRLPEDRVRLFVCCGNDDPTALDALIDDSPAALLTEGRAVELDDRRVLVGVGYSNATPWQCERDLPEEELAQRLATALDGVERSGAQLVLHTHCPPYDSELDSAVVLDEELRPRTEAGQEIVAPSGSTAVREVVERYEPVLSLHGRALESRGYVRLGRTLAVNPGSEYSDGILRGVLVDFDTDGVAHHLLTSG